MIRLRACVAIGMILTPLALQAQVGDAAEVYAAALRIAPFVEQIGQGPRSVAYRFSDRVAHSPIPEPLWDSAALRKAGIDPAVELRAGTAPLTQGEREWLEGDILIRRGVILRPLTPEDSTALVGAGGPGGYWGRFRDRFPEHSGMLVLSRVAFDTSRSLATVDVDFGCGGLCGNGGAFFLRKGEAGWTVVTPSRFVRVY